jgi:TP901 family phage tail tape measure protein
MADVRLDVEFDEAGLKKSAKKLEKNLEKMDKRLSRKKARNRLKKRRLDKRLEERITRDKVREQVKRDRLDKKLSRKRARNRLKEIKARKRQNAAFAKDESRKEAKEQARKKAIRRGAVGVAGRGAATVGGVIGFSLASLFDSEEVLGFERSLAVLAGQAGITAEAEAKLGAILTDISLKTGVFRTDLLRGFETVVEKSGDFDFATNVIGKLGTAAIGLEGDMSDLGELAAALRVSFGAGPDKISKFFDILTAQGDKGQVTLKNLARISEEVFGKAAGFGIKGERGVNALSALIQTSSGSADERKTIINTLLTEFIAKREKIKKQTGVDTLDKKGNIKNPADLVKAIIKGTGGDITKLQGLFSGKALEQFAFPALAFRETGKFGKLDELLKLGAGSEGLVQKRFKRVEGTGSVGFDKFQNVITLLSESTLAPALTELSNSLTDLLKDKDKIDSLTRLFKTMGEGLGFLVEAVALTGDFIDVISISDKDLKKNIKNFESPSFKDLLNIFTGGSKPSGSIQKSSQRDSLNVQNVVTIDDRGNVKKQRTRVTNQNNSDTGRTLISAGR